MPVASFTTVASQVISLYNAQVNTAAYPASVTDIGTSKRNPGEVKEAVIEADLDCRRAICETPGNGYRNAFVAATGPLLPLAGNAQSARLPERLGPVSAVEVQIAPGDDSWIPAEWCPLSELREIWQNPGDVFQDIGHDSADSPLAGYYFIDENSDLIFWSGNAVRVHVATLGTIDRTAPALLSPDAYTPFLVARAITYLFKHGDQQAFMQHYTQRALELEQLIRQGRTTLPQLEGAQRAA